MSEDNIPLLTDSVGERAAADPADSTAEISDAEIADLRSLITNRGLALVERVIFKAVKDLESTLLDDLLHQMRRELPALVDEILQERFRRGSQSGERDP